MLAGRIVDYIKNNYRDPNLVSLINIASVFKISPGYVSKIFKEYTGMGFKQYLTLYRINIAKKILEDDYTVKVKDVANMVGYENVNSFIRTFTKQENISPDAYRKFHM